MTEELTLEANGLRFRALAAGPADGPVLLLLHGFPEGAESWLPQFDALTASGLRAVAVDLRGYGGSDAPAGEESYRYEHLVADLEGLAAALGGRVHLAGHDWGAAVGWAAASVRPELFLTWTAISMPHPYEWAKAIHDDPEQGRRAAYIDLFRMPGKAEEVLLEDGGRRLRRILAGVPEGVVDGWVRGFSRPGRLTAALDYYRANLGGRAFEPFREPVRVPTLQVFGAADIAFSRVPVDATARRVEAPYRLEVLEGAGHWLQFEKPAEVGRLLVAQATSG